MRILQLIQKQQLRGAEIFASQLSNRLLRDGHEVRMVCLHPGETRLPFTGEVITLDRPPRKRFFDIVGWRLLARSLDSFRPDILQANAGDTLKFAVFSKSLFQWSTPIVFRNANMISEFIDSNPKYWLNKFLVRRLQHVISVSELCRKDFLRTFNFPEGRIDAVPIGIDLHEIGPAPQDLAHIFLEGPVLVNVGSLVKEKNHAGLLRVFEHVARSVHQVQLIIVGEGRLEPELKEIVARLQSKDRIHFLGKRNDVLEIVKASRGFLLPSLIEGLPAAILEAQYCRTPVIAFNVGGISEVVRHGQTGWLFERGDERGFADATVDLLIAHDEQVKAITDLAYQQVVTRFDNDITAKQFLRVYEQVIGDTSN